MHKRVEKMHGMLERNFEVVAEYQKEAEEGKKKLATIAERIDILEDLLGDVAKRLREFVEKMEKGIVTGGQG